VSNSKRANCARITSWRNRRTQRHADRVRARRTTLRQGFIRSVEFIKDIVELRVPEPRLTLTLMARPSSRDGLRDLFAEKLSGRTAYPHVQPRGRTASEVAFTHGGTTAEGVITRSSTVSTRPWAARTCWRFARPSSRPCAISSRRIRCAPDIRHPAELDAPRRAVRVMNVFESHRRRRSSLRTRGPTDPL